VYKGRLSPFLHLFGLECSHGSGLLFLGHPVYSLPFKQDKRFGHPPRPDVLLLYIYYTSSWVYLLFHHKQKITINKTFKPSDTAINLLINYMYDM